MPKEENNTKRSAAESFGEKAAKKFGAGKQKEEEYDFLKSAQKFDKRYKKML